MFVCVRFAVFACVLLFVVVIVFVLFGFVLCVSSVGCCCLFLLFGVWSSFCWYVVDLCIARVCLWLSFVADVFCCLVPFPVNLIVCVVLLFVVLVCVGWLTARAILMYVLFALCSCVCLFLLVVCVCLLCFCCLCCCCRSAGCFYMLLFVSLVWSGGVFCIALFCLFLIICFCFMVCVVVCVFERVVVVLGWCVCFVARFVQTCSLSFVCLCFLLLWVVVLMLVECVVVVVLVGIVGLLCWLFCVCCVFLWFVGLFGAKFIVLVLCAC